jgi:hypothetical protein
MDITGTMVIKDITDIVCMKNIMDVSKLISVPDEDDWCC